MKRVIPSILAMMVGLLSYAQATTQAVVTPPTTSSAVRNPVAATQPATTQGAANQLVPNQPAAALPALVQPGAIKVGVVQPGNGAGALAGDKFIESSRRSMENLRKVATLKTAKKVEKLSDIFSMSYAGEWLDANIDFDSSLGTNFQFQVGENESIWAGSMFKYNIGIEGQTRTQRVVSHYDFVSDELGHIYQTSVITTEASLSLSGQGIGIRISLTETPGMSRMSVYGVQDGRYKSIFQATGTSFRQLEQQHPYEVREYLSPLLYSLTGRYFFTPGATDVYLVFDKLKASDAAIDKIKQILPRLDDEVFETRNAAANEIIAQGAKGIQAILQLDRGKLSDEQNDRLDFILAEQRRTLSKDLLKIRRDTNFLIDCLTYEDEQVRKLAGNEIEKMLGRSIEVDLSQPPDKICELLKNLRDECREMMEGISVTK